MNLPDNPSAAFKERNPELYGGRKEPTIDSRTAPPATNLTFQKSADEQKLNKLEKAWLAQLRLTHPSENIGIQQITLKLAQDTRYTADFTTIDANGQLIFWETKGHMRDDARVKLFVAARSFRHFRFVLVTRVNGQWVEEQIAP